jgi:hypothetical protein
MTTSQAQHDGVVCRYCGLASGVSHARACECVNALLSERNRLREHLRSAGERMGQSTVVLFNAKATPPRMAAIQSSRG